METNKVTEKVTINLTPVDIGRIDLLVSRGLYATRADFLRTAVRGLLLEHGDLVKDVIRRENFSLGFNIWPKGVLEEMRGKGERWRVRHVGLFVIPDSVTPELAGEVFESIEVYGVLRARPEVRAALKDRIR
jgi:Arc/MetJ-type ribon-helix-helix transcriptional regulator